jgi:hypothetical protein
MLLGFLSSLAVLRSPAFVDLARPSVGLVFFYKHVYHLTLIHAVFDGYSLDFTLGV